jgi:hypothetical protein
VPIGGAVDFSAAHMMVPGESDRYDVTAEVWIDGQMIYSRQDDDVFFGM